MLAQAIYSYPILHSVVHDSHRCSKLLRSLSNYPAATKRLVKRSKALQVLLVAQLV